MNFEEKSMKNILFQTPQIFISLAGNVHTTCGSCALMKFCGYLSRSAVMLYLLF